MKLISKHIALCLIISASGYAGLRFVSQAPSKTSSNDNDNNRRVVEATTLLRQRAETLVVLAENAPAEIGSDILLTLSSSSLITDKQRKIEIVDLAFRMAAKSREPIKRRSWSLMADTRAGFKQSAFDLGLDRLTMESNAVVRMLALDRQRARTMFEEITLPRLKSLTCDESLAYDLDPYYQAVSALFAEAFSEDEKKAGVDVQFLLDASEKVKSLAQLVSAAKIVIKAKLSPDDRALISSAFVKALGRVSSDPRSFAFAIEREPFTSTIHNLIIRMKADGLPVKELTNATHRFLTKNLSGEVCGDVEWLKTGSPKVPTTIEGINSEFASPITIDEMRPSTVGAKAGDVIYWTTPTARLLLKKAKQLRFGEGTTELSLAQRQTEDWRGLLHDFLALLGGWDAAAETSEDDYFQQKCRMFRVLVDLCPDDVERDLVLRTYGNYLKDASLTYKGSIDWILPVKQYLGTLRSKSVELRKSALGQWLSSSDSNLRLYGELSLLMETKS